MEESKGSADPDAVGVAWRDEQLQRVRTVLDLAETGADDMALRSKILAQLPDTDDDFVTGIGVFRDLLRVERRSDRFRRLLRSWSVRVAAEVRDGDYERAGVWM